MIVDLLYRLRRWILVAVAGVLVGVPAWGMTHQPVCPPPAYCQDPIGPDAPELLP